MALHPRDDTDCMCQGKKEEGGLVAMKIVSIHRYNDLKAATK